MAIPPSSSTQEITITNYREELSQATDLTGGTVQRVWTGQDEVHRKGEKGKRQARTSGDGSGAPVSVSLWNDREKMFILQLC